MTFIYPTGSNKAHPLPLSPEYKSSIKRAPNKPLIPMRHTLSELTGPVYGHETVREGDADLTTQHKGEPLGERIIVHGHVRDEDDHFLPSPYPLPPRPRGLIMHQRCIINLAT